MLYVLPIRRWLPRAEMCRSVYVYYGNKISVLFNYKFILLELDVLNNIPIILIIFARKIHLLIRPSSVFMIALICFNLGLGFGTIYTELLNNPWN